MGTQHTPGPWGVQDDHGRRYVETLKGNDDSICEVHRRAKGGILSDAEFHANARLIAAAPELLRALDMAVTEESAYGEANGWIEVARAAIAKATEAA
jgi:hypothetical protein